ncbi:integral membrane protein [Venturia nashicola]|uniref:Integral membrane protein n=1 Tax=Venturia nashicola TaxID=86259 RepID=A0A4Z1PDP4_9PEZI|nr:integral membrane protein [Venturia nashicola]
MRRFRSKSDADNKDQDVDNLPVDPPPLATVGPSTATSSTDSPLTSAAQRARDILRRPIASRNDGDSRPSVRVRRTPSSTTVQQFEPPSPPETNNLGTISEEGGRRRSSSEPNRPAWYSLPGAADRMARIRSQEPSMPSVSEEPSTGRRRYIDELAPHLQGHVLPHGAEHGAQHAEPHLAAYREWQEAQERNQPSARLRRAGRNIIGWRPGNENNEGRTLQADAASIGMRSNDEEYDRDMVDLLDVIDPEISTLSTLTNVQNSLFVPNLGSWLNRRPTYNMTRQATNATFKSARPLTAEPIEEEKETDYRLQRPNLTHTDTISSTLTESRYAVMPHGERLYGWSDEEKEELNDLVRHMLHSRRAAFKRGMKGFGQYVRKPLGLFVTVYATLITLFGAAWVLFLIGWLSVGSKKDYVVNVIDNILVALFAIMGDGLAPFRMVDTYHMIYIARYHRLSWKLRKKQHLPKLEDHNDLPTQHPDLDLEGAPGDEEKVEDNAPWEVSVLRPDQEAKLRHHQQKFANSHTFYKPHETETHHAFPLNLLIWIVVLLDCHSLLQIALGTCTWAISYKTRPFALTTVILCCSITVNITGGVLISIGDHRTRKKDVIERMFRQELTSEAIKQVEKRKQKERERNADLEDVQVPAKDTHNQSHEPAHDGAPRPSEDTRRSSGGGFRKLLGKSDAATHA